MTPRTASRPPRTGGFTLVELMITVLMLSVVVISLITVMLSATRSRDASANGIEASEAGRVAIDLMARDLRSAGYGADRENGTPQQPIAYIDSLQVLINENLQPWPDAYGAPAQPLAYDPTVNPQPRPLVSTAWTPPVRYGSGAETVRWTLDLNNDGTVDSDDQADANAVDAQRTPNPDDYELVREVYGYDGGGGNGGTAQRVALVRLPCAGGIAPMFQVYMRGANTPWDWSNGPVPASQLADIARISVQITAPSGKRDWLGRYAHSTYRTQISSMRNVPSNAGSGDTEYMVEGYVFCDSLPVNGLKDTGERGLAGARIQVGLVTTYTNATGHYSVNMPAGTYWVKQLVPPEGFRNAASPETLSVTVPPTTQRNFPDLHVDGAYVTAYVFDDADNDGTQDVDEGPVQGVTVRLRKPTGAVKEVVTGASGYTQSGLLFSPTGTCSLSVVPPDSFIVTTANPVAISISNGIDETRTFGICKPTMGVVKGKVFRDVNRNTTWDTGETGIQNVWVGVTTDGGYTVQGYANTDAEGNYSIAVPANDPPHNTPYSIMVIPPTGYYPTSATSINGVYLQSGQTLTGRNFGMSNFTIITLTANRVLSLVNGDLIENDWNGNHTENRGGDADLVLGSDTGGTDQVSYWFNRWDSTPLFSSNPTAARSAPGAVMAMSLDYLNVDNPLNRPDLVTGCKAATAGNFFVWWCRNTSGNEGHFPTAYSLAYKTADQGDVQAVLTRDLAGGGYPDILVGTRSPTAFNGSLELWTNGEGASPTFARTDEVVTLPAGALGEVSAMALGDFDGDGLDDLVVGAKAAGGGQVWFLKNLGKAANPRFHFEQVFLNANEAVTAMTVMDVDGDGLLDVVAGTLTNAGGGRLLYYRNNGTWGFVVSKAANAPGVVTALAAADLGGGVGPDLAVGYRLGTAGYAGGVRIYYLDAGTIPALGVDPSAGAVVNWVPALTSGNFNYGLTPPAVAPFLPDLAAGAKVTATTGAVIVFIR